MGIALMEKEFAGYRIDSLLGRGGMGVVYRATDLALERPVALKVLAEDLATDPDFRRRFVTESKLAASLDHPNIIPIHAAGEHDGILYIAMRLVPGDDLRTVLRAAGRLAPARAAALVAQVASALDAAHARGLVHRDVKPANVLLTPDDHVYLTDFGLSKRVGPDSQATRTGMVLGTLDYVAPEQIRGDAVGSATDVYSLGCMAAHLLTGEVPFPVPTEEGKLWAHFSQAPPRPSTLVPGIGTAWDAIVARGMAKRPEDRYGTAGELGAAMVAAAASAEPSQRARGPTTGTRPVAAGATKTPAAGPRRAAATGPALLTALSEPFNVAVLGALLVAGAILGTVALMVPLALAVYAAGVWISFRSSRRRHD